VLVRARSRRAGPDRRGDRPDPDDPEGRTPPHPRRRQLVRGRHVDLGPDSRAVAVAVPERIRWVTAEPRPARGATFSREPEPRRLSGTGSWDRAPRTGGRPPDS